MLRNLDSPLPMAVTDPRFHFSQLDTYRNRPALVNPSWGFFFVRHKMLRQRRADPIAVTSRLKGTPEAKTRCAGAAYGLAKAAHFSPAWTRKNPLRGTIPRPGVAPRYLIRPRSSRHQDAFGTLRAAACGLGLAPSGPLPSVSTLLPLLRLRLRGLRPCCGASALNMRRRRAFVVRQPAMNPPCGRNPSVD